MESRKLILFGKNSFVISLPKSWITSNKLKKGDSVYVEENSPELTVLPSEKINIDNPLESLIETDGKSLDTVRDEIISAYLMNADIIELVGDNISRNASEIKKVIRDLSGLEIMELTSRRIVAHVILNEYEVDLDNLLRRVDLIVRSMILDSAGTLKHDMYSDIRARDTDVNRLVWLSFRVLRKAMKNPMLSKKIGMNNVKLLNYWDIIGGLERIGDQTKRVARHIRDPHINPKLAKSIEQLYLSVNGLYLEVMKAYYKKDSALAFEIIKEAGKKNVECNSLLGKSAGVDITLAIGFIKSMNSQIRNIARTITLL